MKIINQTDNDGVVDSAQAPKQATTEAPESQSPMDIGIKKAFAEVASEEAESKAAAPNKVKTNDLIPEAKGVPLEEAKRNPLVGAASNERPKFHEDTRLSDPELTVVIENRHKEGFAESVVMGTRYTEPFSLLGGKLQLVIRSRSNVETDAITAYARHLIATSVIRTDFEYSSYMRKALAIAQIEEINGVRQPEMEAPLFIVEHQDIRDMPAWITRLTQWEGKSEAMMTLVTRCILEFEGRYWEMVRKAKDTDFWQPVGSTGE